MTNDSLATVLTAVAADIELPRDCHECILSPHFLTTPGYRCPTCAQYLVRAATLRQLAEKVEAYVCAVDEQVAAAVVIDGELSCPISPQRSRAHDALLAFIRNPAPAPSPDEKRDNG